MLDKIKEFYNSMSLDELTEHLKSIGIEFIEKKEYRLMDSIKIPDKYQHSINCKYNLGRDKYYNGYAA